jgi:hypothetical protein
LGQFSAAATSSVPDSVPSLRQSCAPRAPSSAVKNTTPSGPAAYRRWPVLIDDAVPGAMSLTSDGAAAGGRSEVGPVGAAPHPSPMSVGASQASAAAAERILF